MSMRERFSFARWWGVARKEFLQLRRDRITFAMIIGIPIIQMTLFGFAINTDPKHLPTAVVLADQSEFTRSFVAAMRNSGYFDIVSTLPDQESGRRARLAHCLPLYRSLCAAGGLRHHDVDSVAGLFQHQRGAVAGP